MDLLKALKDIHQPNPISWWPPAPGWILLIIFLLSLSAFCLIKFLRWKKQQHIHQWVFQQLDLIKKNKTDEALSEISELLKRVCLQKYPRQQVARLHGEQWLQFLDDTGKTHQFTQGPGEILAHGQYQAKTQSDLDAVITLAKQWLQQHV